MKSLKVKQWHQWQWLLAPHQPLWHRWLRILFQTWVVQHPVSSAIAPTWTADFPVLLQVHPFHTIKDLEFLQNIWWDVTDFIHKSTFVVFSLLNMDFSIMFLSGTGRVLPTKRDIQRHLKRQNGTKVLLWMKSGISHHISLKSIRFRCIRCKSWTFHKDLNVSLLLLVNQSDDLDGDEGDTEDGDDTNSDDLEACSSSLSALHFSSLDVAFLASCTPPISTQSSVSKHPSFHIQELQNTSHPDTLKENLIIQVEEPLVRETPHHNQLTDMGVDGVPSPCPAYSDSQSRVASASPLDVCSDWKTCRWPILPPITPQRGERH